MAAGVVSGEELQQRLRREANALRQEFFARNIAKVRALLESNQQAVDAQIQALRVQRQAPKLQGERYPVSFRHAGSDQITSTDAHGTIQRIAARPIAFIKRIPRYSLWTTLPRNYRVEDDPVLRHLPYFGDEDNDKFDYLSHYESTNLLTDSSDDRTMREWLIGQILQQANITLNVLTTLRATTDSPHLGHEKSSSKGHKRTRSGQISQVSDSRVETQALSEIDPALLIHALAKVTKTSKDIIIDSFAEFFRKQQAAREETMDESKQLAAANVDELNAPIREQQLLDSYANLFCRRCMLYDCQLHGLGPAMSSKQYRERAYPADIWLLSAPCGDSCCKVVFSDFFGQSSSKADALTLLSLPSTSFNIEANTPAGWSSLETSLFTRGRQIFGSDVCGVATLMHTRTCAEVFETIRHLGSHHTPQVEEPLAVDKNKDKLKKRKRKTGSVIRGSGRKTSTAVFKRETLVEYTPCDHEGPCDDKCPCVQNNNFCEKYCLCDTSCKKRFPGCRCKHSCNTRVCPCFAAERECDPDLCVSCGASVDLNTPQQDIRCSNVNLQRHLKKHTLLGESEIAGWGLYLAQPVKKHEFLGEYMGELISQEEADRRGKVYDKHAVSFLFNLNQDFVVDAHRKGNKIRFANHSVNPNCVARVTMVNGDHRIGIFAKEDMASGDELFFDYRYSDEALKFVPVEHAHQRRTREIEVGEGSSSEDEIHVDEVQLIP